MAKFQGERRSRYLFFQSVVQQYLEIILFNAQIQDMILQLLLRDAESFATHSVRMQKQRQQFINEIVCLYNDKYEIKESDSAKVCIKNFSDHEFVVDI
jgi:hypothetical protein